MIEWLQKQPEFWEGVFKSEFFMNEDSPYINIGIQNGEIADHAEKCVEALNSLPDSTKSEICRQIIDCAKQGGSNTDFSPEIENVYDILNYCWFTMLYVCTPQDLENAPVSFVLEGEGDRGEVIGFAVKDGKLTYVGVDYLDYIE